MKARMQSLTPAVYRQWLYLLAGLMWSGVGLMLCSLAYGWLVPVASGEALWRALAGLLLALAIYHFGFSKFADRNIHRIDDYLKDKVCIFAFQEWTSYPLVVVMVSMGIGLRVYSPIPKPWLAVLYIGIGGSLFFASFHYYLKLLKMRSNTMH
jgi:hypothetical protein